jgi:hypothetical protein
MYYQLQAIIRDDKVILQPSIYHSCYINNIIGFKVVLSGLAFQAAVTLLATCISLPLASCTRLSTEQPCCLPG